MSNPVPLPDASLRAPTVDSERAGFGRRLRELRRQRSWTLSELAERSGLAISTISKAERGVIALTYDSMRLLARGMGLDMAEFFAPEGEPFAPGSFAVAIGGAHRRQETRNHVFEMLFPEIRNKAMTPMMGTVKAHDILDFDDFLRHAGQEFLLVLEGAVTVFCEGRPPVTLRKGESAYFDSEPGHLYASAGVTDARILVVCTDANGEP